MSGGGFPIVRPNGSLNVSNKLFNTSDFFINCTFNGFFFSYQLASLVRITNAVPFWCSFNNAKVWLGASNPVERLGSWPNVRFTIVLSKSKAAIFVDFELESTLSK